MHGRTHLSWRSSQNVEDPSVSPVPCNTFMAPPKSSQRENEVSEYIVLLITEKTPFILQKHSSNTVYLKKKNQNHSSMQHLCIITHHHNML